MKKLLLSLFLLLPIASYADSIEILAATADAGTSGMFEITDAPSGATIIVHASSGLTAGEYSDVQICHTEATSSCQDLYIDGSQIRLHSTNNAVTIFAIGRFRVDMDNPTNATSIQLNKGSKL